MKKATLWFVALIVLGLVGCGDDASMGGPGGAGGAAGMGGAGGTAGMPLDPALDPVDGVAAFAVVSSAFGESSSITLLEANSDVLALNWLNSGSTYPGLVAALSTDVALPTAQMGDGSVAVLDRFGFDVLSRFDVATGGVYGQLRTDDDNRDPNVDFTAFASNPLDVVFIDQNSAWLSRNNPNAANDAAPEEQGSDLIEIDPATMERTAGRIDFSSLNQTADDQTVFARPARIVRRGEYLLVGLSLLSLGFDVAGSGALAIVDLSDLSLTSVAIPDLTNCGTVQPIPASDDVLVTCGGTPNFETFINDPDTVGHAIVSFDTGTGMASVAEVWVQGDDEDRTAMIRNPVAVGGTRVVAAASSSDGSAMNYAILDVASGDSTDLRAAEPAFGASAFREANDLLLIPGGSAGVHRFDLSGETAVDLGDLFIDANGLPVVAIYGL